MSFLEIKDTTLKFGGVTAVDNLSFSVEEGEVFAIVGPNGAGKSTVFNLISRFYDPYAGSIMFDGHDLLKSKPSGVAAYGVARTFQNIELFDQATVLETNLDDCSPEQLADCTNRLFEAGALDVYQTACVMKKGRMGTQLTVLSAAPRVGLIESILFEHTSAIGIRRYVVDRHKLPRENRTIETKFGPVRVKVVSLPGGGSRLKVEDEDAREVAKREGVSSETVRQHVLKFHSAEPVAGEH